MTAKKAASATRAPRARKPALVAEPSEVSLPATKPPSLLAELRALIVATR